MLKDEHKEFIKSIMIPTSYKRRTWACIKASLQDRFMEINDVSDSSQRWVLKREIGMPYKTLESKPAPATSLISIRKLLEGVFIQAELQNSGIELNFIDKFSVNTRHHKFRGWATKGKKGYVKTDSNHF